MGPGKGSLFAIQHENRGGLTRIAAIVYTTIYPIAQDDIDLGDIRLRAGPAFLKPETATIQAVREVGDEGAKTPVCPDHLFAHSQQDADGGLHLQGGHIQFGHGWGLRMTVKGSFNNGHHFGK